MQSGRERSISENEPPLQGENFPARTAFARMKCPSCATSFEAPESRCPTCRISLQKLDLKFGMVPRHSRFLADRSGRLTLPEMEELRQSLRLFEKKFPQILFSVFIAELPPDGSASEYAFWLANRGRFSSQERKQADNFDLLLVIDVTSESVALTTGYGLEKHVSEEDLEEALQAAESQWRDGDLAQGIQSCIDFLVRRMRVLAAKARHQELDLVEIGE